MKLELWNLFALHNRITISEQITNCLLRTFINEVLPYMLSSEGRVGVTWGLLVTCLWVWQNIFGVNGVVGCVGAGGWGLGKKWCGPLLD